MEELKECPFCGRKKVFCHAIGWKNGLQWWEVFCPKCGNGTNEWPSREKAIASWNMRIEDKEETKNGEQGNTRRHSENE